MAKAGKPLEPRSDNPSLNSRLRAATDIQSSVRPEDYPADDRSEQVAPADGHGAKSRAKDAARAEKR